MTVDAGFVKLYRTLLGHPAFRNDAEAMAFAWMVIRASWKASRVRYKDRVITLQRGQLAMSVRDMGAAMDRDKAWVERLWKRLKSETMIETATDAGVSVVTICNYDVFQGDRDTSETVGETPDEAGARQAQDTEQRREEDKNTSEAKASSVSRAPKPASRGSKIPEDWQPELTDRSQSIVDGWPPGRFERELRRFRDHAADKGRISKDWQAAFRTWIEKADDFGPPRQQNSPTPGIGRNGAGAIRDPVLAHFANASRLG